MFQGAAREKQTMDIVGGRLTFSARLIPILICAQHSWCQGEGRVQHALIETAFLKLFVGVI